MKYVILLGDGMADQPVPELGGKTPLQAAVKPNMDMLAHEGITGMVTTIPAGMPTGSDTANMAVFGYDPALFYTGRSPIEAISMGVDLKDDDIAFRCNLVTLSDDAGYGDKTMIDYSSDEISTEEARVLIEGLNKIIGIERMNFYPGISYRHCLVWNRGTGGMELTAPHDILGRKIKEYLPEGKGSSIFVKIMQESFSFLSGHEVNRKRSERGLKPANSVWLWGEGKKLSLPDFRLKYGLKGSVISAVDLVKGIGIAAGMRAVKVEGATGNMNTNFRGKAIAALSELESGQDLVYIHIEAPDECGHRHEVEEKVRSIELIDRDVLGVILKGLEKYDDYKILLLPDHQTPLVLRTHTGEPVPFAAYRKSSNKQVLDLTGIGMELPLRNPVNPGEDFKLEHPGILGKMRQNVLSACSYNETEALGTSLHIANGHELMGRFTGGQAKS